MQQFAGDKLPSDTAPPVSPLFYTVVYLFDAISDVADRND